MAIFLLDTSVIIDALNEKKERNAFLLDIVEQGHALACCPVNVAEVYAGLRASEERRTLELLSSLYFFPITFRIAELAGRLKRIHGGKGKDPDYSRYDDRGGGYKQSADPAHRQHQRFSDEGASVISPPSSLDGPHRTRPNIMSTRRGTVTILYKVHVKTA